MNNLEENLYYVGAKKLKEMKISPVKPHADPQHVQRKTFKSRVADTLAINEDHVLDYKSHVYDENVLILKQQADDLDPLMLLIKEKNESK